MKAVNLVLLAMMLLVLTMGIGLKTHVDGVVEDDVGDY